MKTHYLKIIDDTDVSSDTIYASQQIERIAGYSVQFVWASAIGDIEATIMLQASNDEESWDTISCASYEITTKDVTTRLFNLPDVYYRYFRPKVTVAGGSLSTLTAHYFLKGL